MSHFNVSLTVRAKSQDSVHKPQFLKKRKECRSGSNRGPSAYQPRALPLGHTGSQGYVLLFIDVAGEGGGGQGGWGSCDGDTEAFVQRGMVFFWRQQVAK